MRNETFFLFSFQVKMLLQQRLVLFVLVLTIHLSSNCKISEFQCQRSALCIRLDQVCDGKDQCGDRSDEAEGCSRKKERKKSPTKTKKALESNLIRIPRIPEIKIQNWRFFLPLSSSSSPFSEEQLNLHLKHSFWTCKKTTKARAKKILNFLVTETVTNTERRKFTESFCFVFEWSFIFIQALTRPEQREIILSLPFYARPFPYQFTSWIMQLYFILFALGIRKEGENAAQLN